MKWLITRHQKKKHPLINLNKCTLRKGLLGKWGHVHVFHTPFTNTSPYHQPHLHHKILLPLSIPAWCTSRLWQYSLLQMKIRTKREHVFYTHKVHKFMHSISLSLAPHIVGFFYCLPSLHDVHVHVLQDNGHTYSSGKTGELSHFLVQC